MEFFLQNRIIKIALLCPALIVNSYPFSATFWQLKNAQQHVGRFWVAPDDVKSSVYEPACML